MHLVVTAFAVCPAGRGTKDFAGRDKKVNAYSCSGRGGWSERILGFTDADFYNR